MLLSHSPNLLLCRGCTNWLARPLRRSTTPFTRARKHYSSTPTTTRPFRVAIVGSGPAGFYAAYRLLGKAQNATVDMYEQLPVPFGLVRYGVAPDHPEVKNCQDKFTEVAESPRFKFIGNVELGSGLPLRTLKPHYDAILFAYGASRDRELRIPGEKGTKGVFSARAFVGWYNGLPEHGDLNPDLTAGEDAVVIGQGNVALDVARVLLTDVDVLRKTDMADHALEALSKSRIKRVRVVGRRGPMQAAFTIKELRELIQIPSVSFDPIPSPLFPPDSTISTLPRAQKRLTQLLAKGSPTPPTAPKSWSLNFLLSPHSFHTLPSNPTHLSHITFTQTHLDPSNPFSPTARVSPLLGPDGKAQTTSLPASLCFRSIGYQSLPLPGFEELNIPFDLDRGLIPNDGFGRAVNTPALPDEVVEDDSKSVAVHVPGVYCAGWVKRGPTGVIATTMTDAFTTADAIAADWEVHVSGGGGMEFLNGSGEGEGTGLGWEGVRPEAEKLGLRPTSWRDWLEIDRVEKERGEGRGKVREKFVRVEEMLSVLD